MPWAVNFWLARRLNRRLYYGWVVVGVVLVGNLAAFSLNPVFGLFMTPLEQEFGWNRSTISRSLTLGTVIGAALAPGVGLLIDRIGTRLPMVLFGIVASGGYLLLSQVQNEWQFNLLVGGIFALLLMGVGQMMSSVTVNRWFVRRRGRAMGMVMMGASLGSVIMIPVATLVIATWGWRTAFMVMGGLAILFIVVPAFLLMINTPEQLQLSDHDELHVGTPRPEGGAPGAPGATASARPPSAALLRAAETWTLREAMHTRTFWLTLLGLAVGAFAQQGYFAHAVPHMEAQGFPRLLASTVWSTFFACGVLAKFLWGFLIERIGVRVALIALFTGEAVGLWLLLTATSPVWLFVWAVINAFGHGPYLQLQAMVWADYFGRRSIGRIYGVVQPAIVVAGSLGPWLGGWLFDQRGTYHEFFLFGIALNAVAVLLFAITPPPRRALKPT